MLRKTFGAGLVIDWRKVKNGGRGKMRMAFRVAARQFRQFDERRGSLPRAERLDIRRRAVPDPAVELGLVLELVPAAARHGDEAAIHLRKGRHVAPQLFELADRENVFLAVAPALFDVLERD